MHFDLATRIVTLSVGELASFSLGPRATGGGAGGLWRAQLGQHWHTELRHRAEEEPGARFEVPVDGDYHHRGWLFRLAGRVDQYLPSPAGGVRLRELKTVTRPLPADEAELHAEYPAYFIQLATYLALHALAPGAEAARGELVFIEAASGLLQVVAAPPGCTTILHGQLDEIVDFLDARRRAAERRRTMPVRPAFSEFRPGQEHVRRDLRTALGLDTDSPPTDHRSPTTGPLCFEAPTGFGKTGCLLEFALTALKNGEYDRLVYVTGKSTGQLQVIRQLEAMIESPPTVDGPPSTVHRLPVWQVRSKAEHCINTVYHCLPDACPFIADAPERWPGSGLARLYVLDHAAHELETLRDAGRAARICPYEITRAALPYNDVWIGDYNYVFAPANRGVFFDQPGFDPASTLLIVDEAHNLPARVADAYSHAVRAADAWSTYDALRAARAPASFVLAWEAWARELDDLRSCEAIDGATEIGLRAAARRLAEVIPSTALDFVALGPRVSELLWQIPALDEFLDAAELPKLLWCPTRGELRVTCLDAANAIAASLRQFRHAILTSATLTPLDAFAAACGLDRAVPVGRDLGRAASAPTPAIDLAATLGKLPRTAKRTLRGLTTGAALLRVEEEQTPPPVPFVRAETPWRRGAYRVAIDTRVDTRWERRTHHFETTAETIAKLHAASTDHSLLPTDNRPPVVVFFPSYAYAEAVAETCFLTQPGMRIAQQPRGLDLAAQTAFIEGALTSSDAIFLVLGTGYTEGIDLLGGRVSHALVVGPALPEVNAVQRAKLAQCEAPSRDAAFRLVYQVPGMQKVNQALGRLVRAPGHRAVVLLHCRRFAERSYLELLDPEIRQATIVDADETLTAWLRGRDLG